MRREQVHATTTTFAFEFFYWFSRFEFALKENGFLKSKEIGSKAEPGWDEFVREFCGQYEPLPEAQFLLGNAPSRQIIADGGSLTWSAVGLSDCRSNLAKVVRLLKTVRNNLFHGGKHGADSWDDINRTHDLLKNGKLVLDQLSELGPLKGDYLCRY